MRLHAPLSCLTREGPGIGIERNHVDEAWLAFESDNICRACDASLTPVTLLNFACQCVLLAASD